MRCYCLLSGSMMVAGDAKSQHTCMMLMALRCIVQVGAKKGDRVWMLGFGTGFQVQQRCLPGPTRCQHSARVLDLKGPHALVSCPGPFYELIRFYPLRVSKLAPEY